MYNGNKNEVKETRKNLASPFQLNSSILSMT